MRKSQDLWVSTSVSEMYNLLDQMPEWQIVGKQAYSKIKYIDISATLDIETYNQPEDGYIYTIQTNIRGQNFLCRYVEDFIDLCDRLVESLHLSEELRLVFYVHNLGYEMQYLLQLLNEEWGIPSILLTKSHKPLYIKWGNGIEFRDSLKLFQKSLAKATKGLPHEKMVGDLDYKYPYTPDIPLSPDAWNYCINDVQGLYEAIERLKAEHGYNQATIPYTNTSMVIDAVNRKCRDNGDMIKACRDLTLDKDMMRLAYKAMAGGDTHGTRWRAGQTFEDCNSYDLKSAHPSQQILDNFPSGKPQMLKGIQSEPVLKTFCDDMGMGWIAKVLITNLVIKPECPDPTISVSKTDEIKEAYGYDNGRLLGADACICYMDSNDYQRFIEAYDYEELYGLEVMVFHLKPLPEAFRGAILDFFTVKESAEPGSERDFSKICVNTIFGACAQKTIRDEYTMDFDQLYVSRLDWEDNLQSKDDGQVAKSQKNKFPFLWGLWTSSLSRLKLWKLIKTVGWEKVIYWDTDSCKYQGEKIPEVDSVYNANVRSKCEERGAVVINRKGKTVYIGSAEDEHPTVEYGYKRFRFLHAKCYAAEAWDGSKYVLESTIAGVGKKEGVKGINDAYMKYGKPSERPIDMLRDGLYIPYAGGLKLFYQNRIPQAVTRWSRPTRVASYIYMEDRDYMVSDKPPEGLEFEVMVS